MKARLLHTLDLAPEVRHFAFEVADGKEFPFTAGQFISLKQQVAGREVTRAYSIASPPNGNSFALCLNRVSDGLLSPLLFEMLPGDEIEVQEPLGYFTLRHLAKPAVFIATGTGIAPIRSILQDALGKMTAPCALIFGVRYEHSLLYGDEWEALAERHPSFRFMPTVTRPTEKWHGRTGRVQTHLDEALAHAPAADVYICGLKEMVDDVRALLKAKGFERKRIIYEKYD